MKLDLENSYNYFKIKNQQQQETASTGEDTFFYKMIILLTTEDLLKPKNSRQDGKEKPMIVS